MERLTVMEGSSAAEAIIRLASGRIVPCNDAKPFTVEEASERLKDLPGWIQRSGSI